MALSWCAAGADMEQEFDAWKTDPTPQNLQSLVGAANNNIGKALQMYAGNDKDPIARSHAKVLAVRAFKSYDPTKGTKLRTHFLNQMQPLRRFSAQRRFVFNVPERVQVDMANLNNAKQELADKFDRTPTDLELADHTGLSMQRIQRLRKRQLDLSESSRLDEAGEVFQDVEQDASNLGTWTQFVYHDLNAVDRKIFEWRTGFNGRKRLTNNEIAKRLRLTPGAVSQRVDKIYSKIAEGMPGAR